MGSPPCINTTVIGVTYITTPRCFRSNVPNSAWIFCKIDTSLTWISNLSWEVTPSILENPKNMVFYPFCEQHIVEAHANKKHPQQTSPTKRDACLAWRWWNLNGRIWLVRWKEPVYINYSPSFIVENLSLQSTSSKFIAFFVLICSRA